MAGKPAYAVVQLSHMAKPFYPGDRIDEAIPEDIIAGCVQRGEASHDKPKAAAVVEQEPVVEADPLGIAPADE
jgi:hypothetical protein